MQFFRYYRGVSNSDAMMRFIRAAGFLMILTPWRRAAAALATARRLSRPTAERWAPDTSARRHFIPLSTVYFLGARGSAPRRRWQRHRRHAGPICRPPPLGALSCCTSAGHLLARFRHDATSGRMLITGSSTPRLEEIVISGLASKMALAYLRSRARPRASTMRPSFAAWPHIEPNSNDYLIFSSVSDCRSRRR